jgi:hypothetical protein
MKPFDVAISFAGEDRGIANQLAQLLKASGLLIFYDDDDDLSFWARTFLNI